ncbi:ABC transporter permease [Bacillus sp. FJAT-49732]|uniref:ABC transporter permease n=1 Tax=Lederbergia citrisecunda TaxID=2833583 RepID=A0A942YIF6_9BACI|nr:ABC transporter permease [Lederbergia citrisecunda]MBS4198273.1 ABC transporter permease [Lederbergia citrisecunda]
MLNLIKNEWIKIFKQVSTYIMIGFLLLVIIAAGGITKYVESKEKPANENWKQELIAQNEQYKKQLADVELAAPSLKEFYSKEIAINEYRIEHNLPPQDSYSVWDFIKESSGLTSFVGLLVIIIASGIVAHEFSWGTIKILLIKPYKRWKILMAKYITTVLYLLTMLAILFATVSILGLIIFGKGTTDSVHLAYVNGAVVEQNLLLYLIKTYILNSLSVFLLTTMAFMISAVFRNSGLAIGISIFLLLMGGTITNLLAAKFDWAKYSLFANTNLMQYVDGVPLVDGMTLSFSILMIIIYFVIFHAMAFVFFTKRDIAN